MINTLIFLPKGLRKKYIQNLKNSGIGTDPDKYHKITLSIGILLAIIFGIVFFIINFPIAYALFIIVAVEIISVLRVSLMAATRIKKMEEFFPDVISLMASNLRSGMTIDRAFLISARPEFDPLDKEILKTGRDISTGQDIITALEAMGKRIDSEKISKIVSLIISGIKAGGNISDLLEQTANNMKEKEILEKKAASTLTMYIMFIFFAVGVGAPILFGLSTILVEVVINLTSRLPDFGAAQLDMPFSFSKIEISLNFVVWFSVIFMVVSDLISSLVIGLVQKGEGKFGLKFFFPLVAVGLTIFFIIRIFLAEMILGTISNF